MPCTSISTSKQSLYIFGYSDLFSFKWINQLDAAISQVYYLSLNYSSTCFMRPHAHHQELNDCSSSLPLERGGSSAVGRGPTTTNSTATTTLQW
jgi:hypothetical protein